MTQRQLSRSSEPEKAKRRIPPGAERSAFVDRLQTVLSHWPSADRLAKAMGVSPSAFRKWLKGEAEPSRERLAALADVTGVAIGWLVTGEGPEPKLEGPVRQKQSTGADRPGWDFRRFVVLPERPEAAAAGAETPAAPLPVAEFIAFHHDWVRTVLGIEPEGLQVETAVGESMEPGIHDGDLLLLDTTERDFRSFGVYVLEIRGERLVKRVQRKLDGTLTLISDNPVYETEHVPADLASGVRVIGRVMWSCGPV